MLQDFPRVAKRVTRSNIVAAKSKVTNRIMMTNKCVSGVLGMRLGVLTVRVLLPDLQRRNVKIHIIRDSTANCCLFSMVLMLKNFLIQNTISAVKARSLDLIGLMPN